MKTIIQSLFLIFVTLFFSACTEYYYDVTDELEGKVDEWGGKVDELEGRVADNINRNGSRIIFRNILLEDGSIYQDNRPFDTLYNRVCSIEEAGVLKGCCVSFMNINFPMMIFKVPYYDRYSDSECTNLLNTKYFINRDSSKDISLKEGLFFQDFQEESSEYQTPIIKVQKIEDIPYDIKVFVKKGIVVTKRIMIFL